jgi:hypothetical protein
MCRAPSVLTKPATTDIKHHFGRFPGAMESPSIPAPQSSVDTSLDIAYQTPYQYDALPCHNSLRLLSLKPGKEEDPLVVDLEIVQGEAVDTRLADSYALSYVWGYPTRAGSITCNTRLLKITLSLSFALQAIREQDAEVIIWADAICINQNDPFERNHQIKLIWCGSVLIAEAMVKRLSDYHAAFQPISRSQLT